VRLRSGLPIFCPDSHFLFGRRPALPNFYFFWGGDSCGSLRRCPPPVWNRLDCAPQIKGGGTVPILFSQFRENCHGKHAFCRSKSGAYLARSMYWQYAVVPRQTHGGPTQRMAVSILRLTAVFRVISVCCRKQLIYIGLRHGIAAYLRQYRPVLRPSRRGIQRGACCQGFSASCLPSVRARVP
jgi:hypothetical protein